MNLPITSIVFDVLGTIVDERGSTITETVQAFTDAGLPADQGVELAQRWLASVNEDVARRARGEAPWQPMGALRRDALQRTLTPGQQAVLGHERIVRLANVGHRLHAWPDSVAAIDTLARRSTVIALTNGTLAQSVAMSSHAGLRWHALLTSDLVHAFKPDSRMYRVPIGRLELDPAATLFAAAHPWDLRAAADHGYQTAFVDRPDADRPTPHEFDVQVQGLDGLAHALITDPEGCS